MGSLLLIGFLAAAGYIVYLSTSGGGSSMDASGVDPITQKLAQAIAFAEGFYIPGSRAARNHNPGDMTQDLIGRGVGMDGSFIIYQNDADGWANLYAQVSSWLNGSSAHADKSFSIADISQFYTTPGTTGQDQINWANNVASQLGVDPDTSIGSL